MKICLVCSHGGHLTEMLQLMPAFDGEETFFVTYHSQRDKEVKQWGRAYFTTNIGTSPLRMLRCCFWAVRVLKSERPDAIISMGAELAIPFLYLGRLWGIRTLYIESFCRVNKLSRTGKLVYPVAGQFWVQWPQLLPACGKKARFLGSVL